MSFPGKYSCYAFAGLTTPARDGRNPRIPSVRMTSFKAMPSKDWDEDECLLNVTNGAIESLNKSSIKDLLANIEATAANGKHLQNEPQDKTKVQISSINLSDEGVDAVFNRIHEADVQGVFDYRQVQTNVYVDGFKFNDGFITCIGISSISARKPVDRNQRWPENWVGKIRLQDGGNVDGCKNVVAQNAVVELFNQDWTENGLLKDFSRVREDGIPTPSPATLSKLKEKKTKPQKAQTTSKNALTCTNHCVNGDCLRTFENGRKERWQAPRTFNLLTNNWEWDTLTNACGL